MFVVDVEAIKHFIDESGMKQKTIANKAGLDERQFCLILQGKRKLEAAEYANICKAAGVPMNRFLTIRE